jgi:hypothetical protein
MADVRRQASDVRAAGSLRHQHDRAEMGRVQRCCVRHNAVQDPPRRVGAPNHDGLSRRCRCALAGGAAIIASVGGKDLEPFFAGQSLNGISHHHSGAALRILEQFREGLLTENKQKSNFYERASTARNLGATITAESAMSMASPGIKSRTLAVDPDDAYAA